MAAPLYTGLAVGACLIRSMSDVYGPGALALYEAATAVPNAMLCPGRTPSLRSSSDVSPSSALTICTKNTIAIHCRRFGAAISTAGVVESKQDVSICRRIRTWLILGRFLAEWRTAAAALATMRAISTGS